MSRDQDLDLDAILAEFHADEKRPAAPAPAPAPAPRRRREEVVPPPGESTYRLFPQEPRPAAAPARVTPESRETPPRREQPARPARLSAPAQQPADEGQERSPARAETRPRPSQVSRPAPDAARERRQASRKAAGRLHMAVVLLALVALLAGALFWTIREERRNAAREPEPIRLELGQRLEEHLDAAATTTR